MKVSLRTSFTIDQGEEMTRDLTVDLPIGTDPSKLSVIDLMLLAADHLVASGQVMVSSAEIVADTAAQPGSALADA